MAATASCRNLAVPSAVSPFSISYYKIEDVESGRLRSLASLDIRTRQNSKLAPMVLHATVQKLTTSYALLAPLASEMPLLTVGRVTED